MADLTATTPSGKVVSLTPSASDPDGDSLTFTMLSPPANGTATTAGGSFTYTPTAGFAGSDGFTFALSDGKLTTTGLARITVEGPTGPALDTAVSVDFARADISATTPPLATANDGELLLAFVAIDGAGRGGSVSGITAGSLKFLRTATRKHDQGTVEIWQANASTRIATPVSAKLRRCDQCTGSMAVAAFQNTAPKAGAVGGDDGRSVHAGVKVKATAAGSLIWAVGQESTQAAAVVPDPGQVLVHQYQNPWSRTPSGCSGSRVNPGRRPGRARDHAAVDQRLADARRRDPPTGVGPSC